MGRQETPSLDFNVPASSGHVRSATASNRAISNTRRATALVAALLLLSGAAFSWNTWRTEKELELQHYASLVKLGTQSLELHFSNFEKALGNLGQESLVSGQRIDPSRALDKPHRFAKTYSEFRSVTLFHLDGKVLASADFSGPASIGATPSFISSREELQNGRMLRLVGRKNPLRPRTIAGDIGRAPLRSQTSAQCRGGRRRDELRPGRRDHF